MSEVETSEKAPITSTCPSCGGRPRWESIVDGDGERWLSVCRCGLMRAFLPDLPNLDPEDPLTAYLVGLGRTLVPASPPWIRCFLRSVQRSAPVHWRYCPGQCPRCQTATSFAMRACPRPNVLAICMLCLGCGYVTADYSEHSFLMSEGAAAGDTWTPPCPAVQRLRDCIFRPYATLTEGEDGNLSQWVMAG